MIFKNRSLSKIFLFFILIFCMFMLPFADNVRATNIKILETWEDYNVGSLSGVGDYFNWEQETWYTNYKNTTVVLDDVFDGGVKSLELPNPANNQRSSVFFNFTTDFSYIYSINFSLYLLMQGVAQSKDYYIDFFNDSILILRIKFSVDVATEQIYYYPQNGSYTTIAKDGQITADGAYHKYWLVITHLGDNLMQYAIESTTSAYFSANGTAYNGGNTWDYATIDRIKIYCDLGNSNCNLNFRVDDIKIDTDWGGGGIGGGGCGDFPDIPYIGTIYGGYFYPISNPYIISQYNVEKSATFYYLDIDAGATHYTNDPTLSHYQAYLNGNYLGIADCFFAYMDTYILRFDFSSTPITLTNEKPLIVLYHSTTVNPGVYWQIGVSPNSNTDLDNDLDVELKSSTYSQTTYIGAVTNYDLSYRLYYAGAIPINQTKYYETDNIALSGNGGCTLADGTPCYFAYTNSVFISYFLSTMTQTSYLRIWRLDDSPDSEVGLTQGFGLGEGKNLLTTDGTKGFVPYNSGTYQVSIWRGSSNVSNRTFYVYGVIDENKVLYTVPNPSDMNSAYGVYYNYTHPDKWKGAVGMSFSPDINNISDCQYIKDDIASGSTGWFPYQSNEMSIKTHYWRLFTRYENGSFYMPYGGVHTHYCKDTTVTTDNIICDPKIVSLHYSVTISGYHNHLGGDVWIKINNVAWKYIGDNQIFDYNYYTQEGGLHNVSLELNNNGTWVILDYDYFNVSGGGDEEINVEQPLLPPFPPEMGALVGVVIIACFTLLPLLIAVMINRNSQSEISVHPLVYAFFMVIGLVLCIQLTLFPYWVMFFILFMIILIIAMLWLSKSKEG